MEGSLPFRPPEVGDAKMLLTSNPLRSGVRVNTANFSCMGCEFSRSTMEPSNPIIGDPRLPPGAASESRASMLLGVNIGLMVLASAFIFARFYTRYVVLNRLGYDDWLSLLALVGFPLCAIFSRNTLETDLGSSTRCSFLPQA